MSVDRDDRDLEAELASDAAGQRGIPFDAICTGCQRTRVKRAQPEDVGQHPQIDPMSLDASECTSFKHVCHRCQKATFWNPLAVLSGLSASEDGGDDDT
ncbi:hypothetical protein [Natrinema ejinorense]|uniref:Uncharacterized protein n=1 Tax=Natrinema ejinorense TaxID=373386 RepID=A0A2A5QRK8_9EURY|nr:hypothetical protein [Natrinema ejinorense]PCR89429.1 hypothetical protein CP557_02085 [Natrinema ejinorense]